MERFFLSLYFQESEFFKIFRTVLSFVAIGGFPITDWIIKINQLLMDTTVINCILLAGLFVRNPLNVAEAHGRSTNESGVQIPRSAPLLFSLLYALFSYKSVVFVANLYLLALNYLIIN